jgi:hypothetical protein
MGGDAFDELNAAFLATVGSIDAFLKEIQEAPRALASPDQPGRYEARAQVLGKLVDEKQAAYGNSFGNAGKVMAVLYPNGISLEQMDDALVVVRIIDKLFRIANRKDAFGESPFNDIAGYGLLGADE